MIKGVVISDLATHADERGFFREVIRSTDDCFVAGFGQMSHSLVQEGVIKAWHAHKKQFQWNYVVLGLVNVVLCDLRKESSTYLEKVELLVGDDQQPRLYGFPPGVFHGYKCINGPMHIIYVTSDVYDPEEEVRLDCDDPLMGTIGLISKMDYSINFMCPRGM